MESLLEKTRRINKLLQRSAGRPVDFREMAKVLSDLVRCNVYIVSRRGKILGNALAEGFECTSEAVKGEAFPSECNDKLLKIDETSPNVAPGDFGNVFQKPQNCENEPVAVTVVPVIGGGERLGTLILSKYDGSFVDEDLILAEYGATVVGTEILRSKTDRVEEEARKKAAVQVAIGTLSYSELEAVQHIFDELDGREGFLVASKIADRVGITRSVIVNALRKFESAGVVESRSLGMKGTYIKVLNDRLIEELKKLR